MKQAGVIGHTETMKALTSALKSGRVGHAFLFVGPEHVGKKTVARFLANRLLCQDPARPGACDCDSCRRFQSGVHPDFITVTPSGNSIKIEQLRELQHQAYLGPVLGRNKIFFFPEAEKLTEAAGNSFLKILEDAPPGVVFLFTAVRADYILGTIRSRCQVYNLFPVPAEILCAALMEAGLPEAEARQKAEASNGLPGLALQSAPEQPVDFPAFSALLQQDLLQLLKLVGELEVLERPQVVQMLQQWLTQVRMGLDRVRQGETVSSRNLKTTIHIIEKLTEMIRMVEQNVSIRLVLEDFFITVKSEA